MCVFVSNGVGKKMTAGKVHKTSSMIKYTDNWSTPKCAYESIKPYVEEFQLKNELAQLVIWDPFYNENGASADIYMREVFPSAEVIYENVWMDLESDEIPAFARRANLIITNPPFSKKHKQNTTRWLQSIGLPFMTLLPTETVMLKSFRPLVKGLQLIIPNGRLLFERDGKIPNNSPLGTCFFCYGIGLEKDMTFLQ